MNVQKTLYVCGPLTELPEELRQRTKRFYERIADIYCHVAGVRGFVPHEHYDPIRHAGFSPAQVDTAERRQVMEMTSLLVVVAIAPSWGGGIEVEMANNARVPVLVLHERGKNISRLLRGNPAVAEVIAYNSETEALSILSERFKVLAAKAA